MKTQIIHLEAHDDIASAKDKMNWGQSERILLVWPTRANNMDRKIDLVALKRHGNKIGSRLAIVSRDARINYFASQVGIPAYRSIRQSQQVPWEIAPEELDTVPKHRHLKPSIHSLKARGLQLTSKPQGWATIPAARISAFVLGVAGFLALVSIFIPRATISIQPVIQDQRLELNIIADPDRLVVDPSGVVPVVKRTVMVEGRDSLTPSGQISIPRDSATGSITFTNLTDQSIIIPAGTVIRSRENNEIRFTTNTQSRLEAIAGDTTTVSVQAENPGALYNLAPNTLEIVEGDLGLRISASNPESTSGGTDLVSAAPSAQDYDLLAEQLLISLWETALQELGNSQTEMVIILDREPKTIIIEEKTFTPEDPQPTDTLELQMRVEFEISTILQSDLKEFATETLDGQLPQGYTGVTASLVVTPLDIPVELENGHFSISIGITRNMQAAFDEDTIRTLVTGKKAEVATEKIADLYSLDARPETTISPSIWPWMPLLPFQIQIEVSP